MFLLKYVVGTSSREAMKKQNFLAVQGFVGHTRRPEHVHHTVRGRDSQPDLIDDKSTLDAISRAGRERVLGYL